MNSPSPCFRSEAGRSGQATKTCTCIGTAGSPALRRGAPDDSELALAGHRNVAIGIAGRAAGARIESARAGSDTRERDQPFSDRSTGAEIAQFWGQPVGKLSDTTQGRSVPASQPNASEDGVTR